MVAEDGRRWGLKVLSRIEIYRRIMREAERSKSEAQVFKIGQRKRLSKGQRMETAKLKNPNLKGKGWVLYIKGPLNKSKSKSCRSQHRTASKSNVVKVVKDQKDASLKSNGFKFRLWMKKLKGSRRENQKAEWLWKY